MRPPSLRVRVLLPSLALFLVGCSGNESPGTFCPTQGNTGPALVAGRPYLLTAGGLSEEWQAVPLDGVGQAPLPQRGLTGRTPNDLDVVENLLYIVNSGDNTISRIDLDTGSTNACLDVGTGTNPWELVIDPADSTRAWLTTFLTGELLELDLGTLRILRRVTVGPALEGLLVTDTHIAVTLTGFNGTEGDYGTGYVSVRSRQDLSETARLAVPTNPQFLLRGPEGLAHVICTGDYDTGPRGRTGRVVRIETDWSAVRDTLELGGSPARALLAPDGVVYVAAFAGGLMAYDSRSFRGLHTSGNPILGEPGFTALARHRTTLYAANFDGDAVAVVDLGTRTATGGFLVGDGPIALAVRGP